MIFQLNEEIVFPDPHLGEEDGLLAIGGDLSPERLILAYMNGIFPWYAYAHGQIQWWCPMKRFVIFPSEIHVSHSMRTLMNSGKYEVSFNECFDRVIKHCGDLRKDQDGAWLGTDMTEAYTKLHRLGLCRSVEVWHGDRLVGGLYGVTIKKSFIGESMFSLEPSASKVALIALARWMESFGGDMIDCQLETAHLKSMGGRYIDYDEYMSYLKI